MSERISDKQLAKIAERHKYTLFAAYDSEFDPESQSVSNRKAKQCHADRGDLLAEVERLQGSEKMARIAVNEMQLHYDLLQAEVERLEQERRIRDRSISEWQDRWARARQRIEELENKHEYF